MDLNDRSGRAGRLAVVFDLDDVLSCLAFRHRDSRDGRTCGPRTPPYYRPGGRQLPTLTLSVKLKNTAWLVSNRIATLGAASGFQGVSERNCQRPRAGDETTLFLALWEFEVKPGSEELFEKVYGPNGAWAALFVQDSQYRGTRLVKDAARERVYLTLDFWETREAYEKFKKKNAVEYERIDKECEGMTVREKKLGDFGN